MRLVGNETCPMPEDPHLREVSEVLNRSGAWGMVTDREWRLVYVTDDIRLSNGGLRELVPLPIETHYFSPEAMEVMLGWSGGVFSLESYRVMFGATASWLAADAPGGSDGLRELVDPRLRDLVDSIDSAVPTTAISYEVPSATPWGRAVDVVVTGIRLRDESGRFVGTAFSNKPAAGMAVLGTMASAGDLQHFQRMQQLAGATRRPAAILFADLEASSPLARRLSTASYFMLGRRLVRAADECVVDAGGMVGRHAGDGMVAFFVAEIAGSESAAAAACIAAARALRDAVGDVAARSELQPDDVRLRFGLHWGSTLHIGQITTVARAEVNALGDEVNEAARIEACATGGRTLASKALIERLEPDAAVELDIDPARITYTALGDLSTATEKARRDAPAIAVCDV